MSRVGIKIELTHGAFDHTVNIELDQIERDGKTVVPTLAFVDPFGVNETPMATIARILGNDRCEVLITFIFDHINRFLTTSEMRPHLDALFGTHEWINADGLSGDARRTYLHDLYERQLLHNTRAEFVRSFEMQNTRSHTPYFLFFATRHIRGLEKMKAAMWGVDPTGEFRFSDRTNFSQPVLFYAPDFDRLRALIVSRFNGRSVQVEEIERFVVAETPFLATHYKRQVLAELERSSPPLIEVLTPRSRRGSYPDGTRIRFPIEPNPA